MARRVAWVLAVLAWGAGSSQGSVVERAGVAHGLAGRWEQALDRLGPEPADRSGVYFAALALLELGQRTRGLAALRALSDAPGAFGGAALEKGVERLFADGDFEAVVRWFEATRGERFLDEAALRYRVGQSYLLTGAGAKAWTHLEAVGAGPYRAYALHSLSVLLFDEGRLREAVDRLGDAVAAAATDPDPGVARLLADRMRIARGRVVYQSAVAAPGLTPDARSSLFRAAAAQFARVLPASPLYGEALRGLGWCALELADGARALGAFEAAGAADPVGRHEDLWAQGRVLERLGHPDEAARMYGLAREEALASAGREAEAGMGGGPWSALQDRIRAVRGRTGALEELVAAGTAGLTAREARLKATGSAVGRAAGRGEALGSELDGMARRLREYLDGIQASALFAPEDRPRLLGLGERQERLGLELAALEAALVTLGRSEVWVRAQEGDRERAVALWTRLQGVQGRLAGAQLHLLEALKDRVSVREAELAQTIRERSVEVADLAGQVVGARAAVAGAEARSGQLAARLAGLVARRVELEAHLDALAQEARGAEAEGARRAAAARAQELQFRADGYSLDETQALHLWQQRRGGGR